MAEFAEDMRESKAVRVKSLVTLAVPPGRKTPTGKAVRRYRGVCRKNKNGAGTDININAEANVYPDFPAYHRYIRRHHQKYRYQKAQKGEFRDMTEKRVKCGLAVTPSILELCDSHLKSAGVSSRNDFVEKAISFYAGYLNAQQNPQFFRDLFAFNAQEATEQVRKWLGTGQYKIAVELSKVANILAVSCHMDDESLSRLHQRCTEEIKNLGSVPTFESAVCYQRRQ